MFADKPWRPADHPRPGPSWGADTGRLEVLEPNDHAVLFDQGGSASSFALPPTLSTADRVGDSAGIMPEALA
jgi:hypothetical protein